MFAGVVLQNTRLWHHKGFPIPLPDVSAVRVGVQAVPWLPLEVTAAKNAKQGSVFSVRHMFGHHTKMHLALATPIGGCTMEVPVRLLPYSQGGKPWRRGHALNSTTT